MNGTKHTEHFTIPVDHSIAYSPTGSSAGRSWVAVVARSPWDVPTREYREHRPGDGVATGDEGSVCRRRSRFRCRGAACGASACEDGSRSSRGLGGTSEGWTPRRVEEVDTCPMSAGDPPSVAVAAVAGQRTRTAAAAAAAAGPPLVSSCRPHFRCSSRLTLRRESCPPVAR